jgi:hypothetical protein
MTIESRVTRDRNGQPVEVGTRVRVLKMPIGYLDVSLREAGAVRSTIGGEFEVREIDERGTVWFREFTKVHGAHILGLTPDAMEVV